MGVENYWPLIKVESLQSALKESQANSDRMEQNLAERLRQATTSLTAVQVYKVQKSWRCGTMLQVRQPKGECEGRAL